MMTFQPITVDTNIIWHVLRYQAGSLGNAILELPMNSEDAGATWCEITIDERGFCVTDNGSGFESEEDIRQNFGRLGTPHVAGDARFGRFRLGRAKIMGMAQTTWRSSTFQMDVDVRPTDDAGQQRDASTLGYHFITVPEHQPGCVIRGTFYKRLLPSELDRTITEITELAQYASMRILLNGRQINRDPARETWDVITDDYYLRYKRGGGLQIYNMGYRVTVAAAHMYGSGIVVTRRALEVTMARNEVSKSCPLWSVIAAQLQAYFKTQLRKVAPRLDADERRRIVHQLKHGQFCVSDIRDVPLLTDVRGQHHRMVRILKAPAVTVSPRGAPVAETAHRRGIAFVLADETLERFEVETIDELKALLAKFFRRDGLVKEAQHFEQVKTIPLADATASLSELGVVHLQAELTPDERRILTTLNANQNMLVDVLRQLHQYETVKARTIVAGSSDTAEAWTDATTIVLTRPVLARAADGLIGWMLIIALLAHEYAHRMTCDSESHDFEFYERFHEAILMGTTGGYQTLPAVAKQCMDHYVRLLRGANRQLPHTTRKDVDREARFRERRAAHDLPTGSGDIKS